MIKRYKAVVCIVILLAGSLYCGHLAYREYKPVLEAKKQKESINNLAIIEENDDSNVRMIDFEVLQYMNKDIVGWIHIPDTSIDYPILIGETDEKYLNLDMGGNNSKLGSIFSFSDTSRDLTDARIILFGHNMKEYQMFGELKRYIEDREFCRNHSQIYIYTPQKRMEFKVFSIFVCENSDDVLWNVPIKDSSEYQKLLDEIWGRNQYEETNIENVKYIYDKQILSLVTCRGNVGTSYRLVVNAWKEKEELIG